MKKSISVALVLLAFTSIAQPQKFEWSTGYVYSSPQGIMREGIQSAQGFFTEYNYVPKDSRFSFGGIYGQNKSQQAITHNDGTEALVDVTVTNSFLNLLAGGRYYLGNRTVSPFISGKAGYSFFSTGLGVHDSDNHSRCEQNESLNWDGSFVAVAGGGVRVDLLPRKNPGILFLILNVSYTMGGKVRYVGNDIPGNDKAPSSDVSGQFINTQTQVIHERYVGNVYESPIKMLDYRVGILIKPLLKSGTCCRICHPNH